MHNDGRSKRRGVGPLWSGRLLNVILVAGGLVAGGLVTCGCQGESASGTTSSDRRSTASQLESPSPPLRATPPRTSTEPLSRESIAEADVSILFIGNSHSSPIPGWLTNVFAAEQPDTQVVIVAAAGFGFLVDHARNHSTLELVQRGPWDYVVLQAQKYSTSGKYTYPIDGALQLAALAKEQGSQVLMYPEWSHRGSPDEFRRIRKIHDEIASQTAARVAPIGEAWDSVLSEQPDLKLYAADGNHASRLGSYLNACVFYGLITGRPVEVGAPPAGAREIGVLHNRAWQSVSEDPSLAAGKGSSAPESDALGPPK